MNTGIVAAIIIAGGTTALRIAYDPKVRDKSGAMLKVAVAGFAMGALLTLVYAWSSTLANTLAWLLVIATLMLNGNAVGIATQTIFR